MHLSNINCKLVLIFTLIVEESLRFSDLVRIFLSLFYLFQLYLRKYPLSCDMFMCGVICLYYFYNTGKHTIFLISR